MAKKQATAGTETAADTGTTPEQKVDTDPTALLKRIEELEGKVREGEEGALKRVCAAMKVDPAAIAKAETPKEPEEMVRMFVNIPVRVNSTVYQGDVTVPISTARVIQQAIGDRRMRLLRELTGNETILHEIAGVGFAPQVVRRYNELGERIG